MRNDRLEEVLGGRRHRHPADQGDALRDAADDEVEHGRQTKADQERREPHRERVEDTRVAQTWRLLLAFKAPSAGALAIARDVVPKDTRLARRRAKPVLVAAGNASFAGTATLRIKVSLTRAGGRLLKHMQWLKLVA